jgi:hypothetical protein
MPKYLVLVRFNPGQARKEEVQQAGQASKNWVRGLGNALESAYTFTQHGNVQGGCAIVEADSDSALQSLLGANPASKHVRYETHELQEYEAGIDQLNSAL